MITYLLTSVREYLSRVFLIFFLFFFFLFENFYKAKLSNLLISLSLPFLLLFFYCLSFIVLLLLFVFHCSSFIVRLSLLFMFIKISKSQIFDIFRSNVEKIKKRRSSTSGRNFAKINIWRFRFDIYQKAIFILTYFILILIFDFYFLVGFYCLFVAFISISLLNLVSNFILLFYRRFR